MDYTARRNGGGVFEGLYKLIMRRNSIYVTFVIAGAFAGERVSFFILGFFFLCLIAYKLVEEFIIIILRLNKQTDALAYPSISIQINSF
jgi:hypothetical protein